MAKAKLIAPRGGGPTVHRRSSCLAERQASSASVPFAPGQSPSMSLLSVATLAQPSVSPVLSPSPVLPESPSPQPSQVQSPSMSRPFIATLIQPLASSILSPSPVLPESPGPQSSQYQNQSRLKPLLPRPPFLLPICLLVLNPFSLNTQFLLNSHFFYLFFLFYIVLLLFPQYN